MCRSTRYRYFESILNATSDEVDDVMVEADGEWHTSDNKFASDAWRATHPATTPAPAKREPSPVTAKSAPAAEIVHILVDSDEEDEGRVKRELSPNGHASSSFSSLDGGHPPPPSQTPSRQGSRIIDLTLDSDDEMASAPPTVTRPMPLSNASLPARPGPPPLSVPQKRKATEDGYSTPDAAWKKARGPDGSSPSMHHSPHVSASASASASRTHALPGVSYPHGVAQRSSPEAYRYRSPPMSASDFSGFTSASADSRTTSNASTAGSFVHRYPSSPYAASRPSDASSSRWT
jgi:E3 SUMO-protein ligase PIAS1